MGKTSIVGPNSAGPLPPGRSGRAEVRTSPRRSGPGGPARAAKGALRSRLVASPSRAFVLLLCATACAGILYFGTPSTDFTSGDPAANIYVARAARLAGIAACVRVVAAVLGVRADRLDRRAPASARAVLLVGALDIAVVASAQGLVFAELPVVLTPVALASMVLALVVSPLFAALNAWALSVVLVLALGAGSDLALPLVLAAGSMAAVSAASRARRRPALLVAGIGAGVVQAGAVGGVEVALGVTDVAILLRLGAWALAGGVGSGVAALGLLPAAEAAFGVTTDISLADFSDHSRPALRRLLLEAPGTYHHSLSVGNLSEAAALAIGANALLARVASYYHDLGKVDRPEYFVENEPPGRSRHEGLSPTMSTLIITSHVRDGAALAREYGLPRVITDVIRQHHGTSVVEFFYRVAADRLAEESAGTETVDESLFRYEGPKPRTPEAALVLLADTVEAASRTLAEPTAPRLTKLVEDLTMKRLLDGQFDESGLTLRDLRIAGDVFVRVLMSVYHARVAYPKAAAGVRGRGGAGVAGVAGNTR